MALNEEQKKDRSDYLEKNLEITECSQRKSYAFISYASDNWEAVFKSAVVPMQRQYGLRVYADKAFDKVNDKWIVPMLRNIRGADLVIAFVSQSYIESYACFLELLTAVNNRKPIVFVSLEDHLHLGDTTDQPVVERGAKNEILNQGANISTNTNNTSNDIMRAMKSAYTSLSTLLEQDALSKYDISDAFINFFRDASINRKTINDLGAVRRTIKSVSSSVFDQALVSEPVQKPKPVQKAAPIQQAQPVTVVSRPVAAEPTPVQEVQPEPVPVQTAQPEPAPVQTVQPEPAPVQEVQPEPAPVQEVQPEPAPVREVQPEPAPVRRVETEERVDFSFSEQEKGANAKKPLNKKLVGIIAGVAVLLVLVIGILGSGPKSVTDEPYEMKVESISAHITGLYTGEWDKKNKWPTGTGILVIDEDSDNLSGGTYEGEWVDGKFEGQGTITWTSGRVYEGEWIGGDASVGKMTYAEGEDFELYEGEWKNYIQNGQGKMTYSEGIIYEGDWVDGQRTGYGVMTWPSGQVYEGDWVDGVREGKGKTTYSNGDVYEGEFSNDQRNGQGTYTYADGTAESGTWVDGDLIETLELENGTYTGAVLNGKPHGLGIMEYTNGNVYEGEWVDGKREGQGKQTWSGGGYYEGEWKDDLRDGHGKMDWSDGGTYEGEWKGGYTNGQGTNTYLQEDGGYDTYTGTFVDGKRSGYGVYTWEDGTVYEGEWANGKRNGRGKMIYTSGATYEGTFVNSEKHGEGVYTYANGTQVKETWENGTKIEE